MPGCLRSPACELGAGPPLFLGLFGGAGRLASETAPKSLHQNVFQLTKQRRNKGQQHKHHEGCGGWDANRRIPCSSPLYEGIIQVQMMLVFDGLVPKSSLELLRMLLQISSVRSVLGTTYTFFVKGILDRYGPERVCAEIYMCVCPILINIKTDNEIKTSGQTIWKYFDSRQEEEQEWEWEQEEHHQQQGPT